MPNNGNFILVNNKQLFINNLLICRTINLPITSVRAPLLPPAAPPPRFESLRCSARALISAGSWTKLQRSFWPRLGASSASPSSWSSSSSSTSRFSSHRRIWSSIIHLFFLLFYSVELFVCFSYSMIPSFRNFYKFQWTLERWPGIKNDLS